MSTYPGSPSTSRPFAEDSGQADPALLGALDEWAKGGAPDCGALAAGVAEILRRSRLLVPIVRVPEGVEVKAHAHDDHEHEHDHGDHGPDHGHGDHGPDRGHGDPGPDSGHDHGERLGTPTIERSDGRRALLAFSGMATLAQWRADARPLPVTAVIAARAAIDEGADVLLVDGRWPLAGGMLWALAEDRTPVAPHQDPVVVRVVRETAVDVLGGMGLPGSVTIEAHGDGLLVLVDSACAADESSVTAFAQALAAHHVIRTRVRGGLAIGVLAGHD